MRAATRWGIELYSFLTYERSKFPHSSTSASHNSSRLQSNGFLECRHLSSLSQACSTMFISGKEGAQSRTLRLWSWNHLTAHFNVCFGSLSWTKIMSDLLVNWFLSVLRSDLLRILQYWTASMCQSMRWRWPVPFQVKHPQTWRFPPPCLTVFWTFCGRSASPGLLL